MFRVSSRTSLQPILLPFPSFSRSAPCHHVARFATRRTSIPRVSRDDRAARCSGRNLQPSLVGLARSRRCRRRVVHHGQVVGRVVDGHSPRAGGHWKADQETAKWRPQGAGQVWVSPTSCDLYVLVGANRGGSGP